MTQFDSPPASSLILVAGLLTAAGPVHAMEPPTTEATALKQRGDSAMAAGDFAQAVENYSRALTFGAQPALYYNRGRAFQSLKQYAPALLDLEAFARTAPDELRAAVPHLDMIIADVRAQVSQVRVVVAVDDARIYIDDVDMTAVVRDGAPLSAGPHELRIEARGYVTHNAQVHLAGGNMQRIDVSLVPQSAVITLGASRTDVANANNLAQQMASTDSGAPAFYRTWWFWTGVGLATAAAVGTAVVLSNQPSPSQGDIGPGRITSALASF